MRYKITRKGCVFRFSDSGEFGKQLSSVLSLNDKKAALLERESGRKENKTTVIEFTIQLS